MKKDNLIFKEPANLLNDKINNAILEVTVPTNPSIYKENRKINEFLNVINKKKIYDEIR